MSKSKYVTKDSFEMQFGFKYPTAYYSSSAAKKHSYATVEHEGKNVSAETVLSNARNFEL